MHRAEYAPSITCMPATGVPIHHMSACNNRCQRISTGEEYAIKVFPKGASAQKAQSVEVEVLQAARRDFVPNVPVVTAHGEQNGYPWMVQT